MSATTGNVYMASDRKQFERAYEHWKDLHKQRKFSVPRHIGVTAIITSIFPYAKVKELEGWEEFDEQDWEIFNTEAYDIASQLVEEGRTVDVIIGATADDLDEVIEEEQISDVIVIGHGSISDILLRDADNGVYSWVRASKHTTHLKTGFFEQRQCGIYKRNISVPLGLFVVQRHDHVYAAKGQIFEPEDLDDPINSAILPVLGTHQELSYELIKEVFSCQ